MDSLKNLLTAPQGTYLNNPPTLSVDNTQQDLLIDSLGNLSCNSVLTAFVGASPAPTVLTGTTVSTQNALDVNVVQTVGGGGGGGGVVSGTHNTTLPTVASGASESVQLTNKGLLLVDSANDQKFNTQIKLVDQIFTSSIVTLTPGVFTFSSVQTNQQYMKFNQKNECLLQIEINSAGFLGYQFLEVAIMESFDFTSATNAQTSRLIFETSNNSFTSLGVPFSTVAKFYKIGIKPTSTSIDVTQNTGILHRPLTDPAAL